MITRSRTLLPWLFLGLVMLTGCATPAVSKLMVAQDVEYAKVFPYSVAVNAMGWRADLNRPMTCSRLRVGLCETSAALFKPL